MAANHALFIRDFARGLVQLHGKFFHVEEIVDKARTLQRTALAAKARGERAQAAAIYRKLIPYLDKMDEFAMSHAPRGLQTQIAKRTIEQLEEPIAQSA